MSGGFYCLSWGSGERGLVVEVVIFKGSRFHRRAARGLLQQKSLLDLFYLPVSRGAV